MAWCVGRALATTLRRMGDSKPLAPPSVPRRLSLPTRGTIGPIAWPSSSPAVGHISASTRAGRGGDSPCASSITPTSQYALMVPIRPRMMFADAPRQRRDAPTRP
eukprot:9503904-Pyramimonas_sp.AAC.3